MFSIGIGSKTSTGGAVIEGNGGVLFDGLVASSIGHKATCPACKKGVGAIVAVGPRTAYLPAGPAARAGDYVACGCTPGANVLVAAGTVSIGSGAAVEKANFLFDQAGQLERDALAIADDDLKLTRTQLRNASPGALGRPSCGSLLDQLLDQGHNEEHSVVDTVAEKGGWKLIGSIDAGGGRVEKSMTLDAGQELKLQAYSDTLGLEGFYVDVRPRPLNELRELASTADALKVVVPPVGRFSGIYQLTDDGNMRRSFTAGLGAGMNLSFHAPYDNANGFRWHIKIPPQEQIHQNSAGYRIDIYGR